MAREVPARGPTAIRQLMQWPIPALPDDYIRVAARRAQQHVADSVATIRHLLSARLTHHLGRCPHCSQRSGKLIQ